MNKRTFLTMLLVGGLIMMGLAGCGENKNSREWIENKVSEVSRVYPTENLFDLFKQFPDGFEIEQVYFKKKSDGIDDFITEIKLKGDATSHTIAGTLAKIPATDDAPKSENVVVSVQYADNKFTFSDEETARKIWKFDSFLFQKLAIDKEFLSKLSLKNKHFNGNNGSFDIDYITKNTTINQYFNKQQQAEAVLGFGGSLRLDDFYYYSITVDFNDNYYFKETVSN
ncbi:hypothetical protein [Streptococcus sinensis]|uniref:hypothetical protein n=1 Tax=Streptococcus sinensis TaxID=176090 RepID=UPI001F48FF78|nr:hypothetical protein [Streptococcus sinensis]MCF1283564.1 hypothetical protein [Streptococcus sinensis]